MPQCSAIVSQEDKSTRMQTRSWARRLRECGVCGMNTGIYTYTTTDTYDGFITVTDKNTYDSAPLCTVKDCAHTGDGCEAYIYGAVYGFRVYDGMLYWVEGIYDPSLAISLVRCQLDGTGREVVWSYDLDTSKPASDEDKKNGTTAADFCSIFYRLQGVIEILIHRGYIYFSGVDGVNNGFFNVACMPLSGGALQMIFSMEAHKGEERCHLAPSGNDLYIMTCEVANEEDDWSRVTSFHRLDTKTRESELLGSAVGDYVAMDYDHDWYREYTTVCEDALLPVPGDGLYFLERFENRAEIFDWEDESTGIFWEHAYIPDSAVTLCRLAFDTGEVERIAKLADGDYDSFFAVSFGDGVVEAHSHGNMYTFDLSGTLTGKWDFMGEYDYPLVDPVGADGSSMYFFCENDGELFWLSVPADGGKMQRFASSPVIEHEVRQPEPGSNEEIFGVYEGPITVTENGEEHSYDGHVALFVSQNH